MFTNRDLFKIILPMILQNIMSIAVSTADSMMVASAGEAAVSGVSLVGSVDTMLVLLFSSLVSGGAVTVSHALGSGDKRYARNCAKQLFYISLIFAVLSTVIAQAFRVPLIDGLYGNAETAVRNNAKIYMAIITLSFPFLAINETGAAVLRVMGNTLTTMTLSLIANVINIIGNAIFIYGCGMGVAGAALATVISRVFWAITLTVILHSKKRDIYYDKLYSYKPDLNVIKKILRIGIPHGIESSMFQFGRLLMQVLVSGMGTAAIAANSVANTLANYHYMPAGAIQNASVTVVGRCYGAKDHDAAKKMSRKLLLWAYVCMWVLSIVLFIFARPIIGIYNLSDKGTKIAVSLTIFHSVAVSVLRPLAFSLPSFFKAAGDVKLSMTVSTVSMWVVRIGAAFILASDSLTLFGITVPCLGLGIIGVWVAMVGDWLTRAIFFTPYYIKNKWLK